MNDPVSNGTAKVVTFFDPANFFDDFSKKIRRPGKWDPSSAKNAYIWGNRSIMEEKKHVSLPENAHRELQPGETYKPLLDPHKRYAEATPYSVAMGILMVVLFSAAAARPGSSTESARSSPWCSIFAR